MVGDRFEGRVALVTGGASGIGRASALAFAAAGASVVIADVDAEGGEETAELVRGVGVEPLFVPCSVDQEAQVASLLSTVEETFGRLDFAHNNAGVEQRRATVTECTSDNWDRTLAINLKGVWLCMKYELPIMTRQGSGAIVNTSSIVGLVGVAGAPAYVASKHGIVGLTRAAAIEAAGDGVRVNAICPGHIRTPMVDRVIDKEPRREQEYERNAPLGRIASPDEVAAAVLWLCSPEASFVTGHPLAIDGGVVAK